jgi:hypothetical protein
MEKIGSNNVVLGRLHSDAIESRFDWLRQLSGSNYFISMKQVLDSDRKIRVVSLTNFSGLSLAEIDEVIEAVDRDVPVNASIVDMIADRLTSTGH